jgi:hypothetical protein
MLREQIAGLVDGVEDALGPGAGFEIVGHFGGGFLPEFFPGVLVDAGVAEEGEFVGSGGDEDEDGIAVGGAIEL